MTDAALAQITQGSLEYVEISLEAPDFLIFCSAIFNDPDRLRKDFPVPVCQCVQIKSLGSQGEGNPERYRIVLSDVKNFVQSMLATRKSQLQPRLKFLLTALQRQITLFTKES